MVESESQKLVEGVVVEALPNEHYLVEVSGGRRIQAHVTGKMRMNFSRFVPGDRVRVESGLDSDAASGSDHFIIAGDAVAPWRMVVRESGGATQITDAQTESASGAFLARSADRDAQEDTRILEWRDEAVFAIEGNPVDLSRQTNGDMAIEISYAVLSSEVGATTLGVGCAGTLCEGAIEISEELRRAVDRGWQTSAVKLSCFADAGADMGQVTAPLVIRSAGPLEFQIADARIVSNTGDASCSL